MVISVLLSAVVLPFVGKACDYFSPKITIPVAFMFRSATAYFFAKLKHPDTYEAFLVCILMIMASIIENISVETIFN
jgi:MFS-type transporter involved in bile tolerance (Atg22 family)